MDGVEGRTGGGYRHRTEPTTKKAVVVGDRWLFIRVIQQVPPVSAAEEGTAAAEAAHFDANNDDNKE